MFRQGWCCRIRRDDNDQVLSHSSVVLPVAAGLTIVAVKVAVSVPRFAGQEAAVAIPLVVVISFVVVGLALLRTDIPPANGWACLLVAASTIPGDLNDPPFAASNLTSVGYVLEPLYLSATVALVLRYPQPRLTPGARLLVAGLLISSCVARLLIALSAGDLPDGFYRPPAWPTFGLAPWVHDWLLLRLAYTATAVLLLLTAATLVRRVIRGGSLAQESLAPLAIIGVTCAVAASVDLAIWALNLSDLKLVAVALIRNLSAAAIPVALLADLLRRRAAGAAVADRVLNAARSPDPSALQAALRDVLVDPSLQLTMATETGAWVGPEGREVTHDQRRGRRAEMVSMDDGTPLLAMTFDARAVQDESLLRTALGAVRLGAENIRLNAELMARIADLQESRARIVRAGTIERQRVERDLHDGAQQRFLTVAATLAQADLVDDDQVRRVVGEARTHLSEALKELRRLAHGIHPAALTQGGLPTALPTLGRGSAIRIDFDIDPNLGTRRPPSDSETALYFVVAEAITNAFRYSGAEHIKVGARWQGDRVMVTVRDDGDGNARIVTGGGLSGLRDRLDALGGTLSLHLDPCPEHPAEQGTCVRAVVGPGGGQ